MNSINFLVILICSLFFLVKCKTFESPQLMQNDREIAQEFSSAPITILSLAVETKAICRDFYESLESNSVHAVNQITIEYLEACNKVPKEELVKVFSDKAYIQQVNISIQDEEKSLEDNMENMEHKQESNDDNLRKQGLLIAGVSLATVAFIGSWVSYKEWKKIDWNKVKFAKPYYAAISKVSKTIGEKERYLQSDLVPRMLVEVDFLGRKLNFIDIASLSFILKADHFVDERIFSNTVSELNNDQLKRELKDIMRNDELTYSEKQLTIRSIINPDNIMHEKMNVVIKALEFKEKNISLASEIVDLRNTNIVNTKTLYQIDPPSTGRFRGSVIAVGILSALSMGAVLAGELALTETSSRLQQFYFDLGDIKEKLLAIHSQNH